MSVRQVFAEFRFSFCEAFLLKIKTAESHPVYFLYFMMAYFNFPQKQNASDLASASMSFKARFSFHS